MRTWEKVVAQLNISRHSLAFLLRYYKASKSLGDHSAIRMSGLTLNVLLRPVHSFYYPEFLKVELTTSCNMSCTFCGAARSHGKPGGRDGKNLNIDTLQEILAHGPMIRWIDLQGVGEPLAHPNFPEILRMLEFRGISVQFTTNATLFDNRVLKCISDGTVHSVTISLSASSAEKYLELHGSAFFDVVLENTRRVVSSRKDGRMRIRMLTVVMSHNLHELTRMIEIAKDVGVDSLVFSAYKPIVLNDQNEPSHQELCRALSDARGYASHVGMQIELEIPAVLKGLTSERGTNSKGCLWPWVGLALNVDGEVMPCCYSMGTRLYELGNLTRQSIYEVFNNKAYNHFREALNTGKTRDLVCHKCNDHAW
jgi:radical SAM protein with 4Fe4S-binding SPASM domain